MPTKPVKLGREGVEELTLAIKNIFKLRSGYQAACYAKRLYDIGVRWEGERASEGILERLRGTVA